MIARLAGPSAMLVDRLDELRQSVAGLRRRSDDRRLPGAILRERQHLREVAGRVVRAGTVRLVHDEDVSDLEHARFDGLDVIAEPRNGHEADRIDDPDHVDLLLPHPDGLDEHDVHSEGIQHVHDPRGRASETAYVTAARHRADEDAVVEKALAYANTVAEDRAAAERARGIDGDDGDSGGPLAIQAREAIDERRLAAAGRARDPDRLSLTGLGVKLAHRLRGTGLVVLDDRDEARDRSLVPRARAREEIRGRGRGH